MAVPERPVVLVVAQHYLPGEKAGGGVLRRFGRVGRVPVILAPEGELAGPALRQKRLKKRVYRWVASPLGLYRDVHWKAAAPHEADAVRVLFPRAREIRVAPNMPPAPESILRSGRDPGMEKRPGELRLVFLSRIAPLKNLAWALEAAKVLTGRVTFDVCGPQEQRDYWASCQGLIDRMPPHVSVTYRGAVAADRVTETLSHYHFMILPTLGESFGHVILEALAAGCPPIISDRTPWHGLAEKGVGWDLPLGDIETWRDVLGRCLAMDGDAYRAMSDRAVGYASAWLRAPEIEQAKADYLRDVVAAFPEPG